MHKIHVKVNEPLDNEVVDVHDVDIMHSFKEDSDKRPFWDSCTVEGPYLHHCLVEWLGLLLEESSKDDSSNIGGPSHFEITVKRLNNAESVQKISNKAPPCVQGFLNGELDGVLEADEIHSDQPAHPVTSIFSSDELAELFSQPQGEITAETLDAAMHLDVEEVSDEALIKYGKQVLREVRETEKRNRSRKAWEAYNESCEFDDTVSWHVWVSMGLHEED